MGRASINCCKTVWYIKFVDVEIFVLIYCEFIRIKPKNYNGFIKKNVSQLNDNTKKVQFRIYTQEKQH